MTSKEQYKYQDKTKELIQKIIFETINKLFGEELLHSANDVEAERPNDPSHGDYSSNIAMKLSKPLGKNPREIADAITREISGETDRFDNVEVAGPGFINFMISKEALIENLKEILDKKEDYGRIETKKDKVILVEHTSPNPNKEYHIGHMKNTVTGLSVSYILEFTGAKVLRDCIDNNRGIAIARLMWGYLEFAKKDQTSPTDLTFWAENKEKWHTPESAGKTPSRFVDELYTKATEPFKNNPKVEQEVRQLVIDWESEEEKTWSLWDLTQRWVWEGYKQVLTRIDGWKFDKIWHEHEIYKKGKDHVKRGVEEGIFKVLDDGAIITDLKEKFGLTDTVLIKKDGTSLYITQDLELTASKRKEFNPDEMYWIIGPEQSLQMKQMFAVCSQLGFGNYEDFHHIPYGFIQVKGKSGSAETISSRKGNAIYVNDLVDESKSRIMQFLSERDLESSEKEEIAETVAIGALKYSLLKVNRMQDMVFDLETSVSFQGDSAPYILYSYARAKSVLRKAVKPLNFDDKQLKFSDPEEFQLLRKLKEFPEVIYSASREYAPNYIALYVYELSQLFNAFYKEQSILNADTEDQKNSRLALTAATTQVIKNGLRLLGIKTVEKM